MDHPETAATKNDSQAEYFKIRELANSYFEKNFHEIMKNVKAASVTIDKVTTTHAYQVIITFFFYEGRIHCYLNKIDHLDTKDYDAPGTARKVAHILRKSLGLTDDGLARVIKHFIYDGVYATAEERVAGGGSLSLIHYFATEIGLNAGDIGGQWDIAHLGQVIYKGVLSDSKFARDTLKFVFDSMKPYTSGKGATFFQEEAKKLYNVFLKNEKPQATRFVFSVLRAMHAFVINCPTLQSIAAQDLEAALEANDNTSAKKAKKINDGLSNGSNIAAVVGLCQILDNYGEMSVYSQSSKKIPTSVWNKIDTCKKKLAEYSTDWHWETAPLPVSKIGTPRTIIDNLLIGKYQPDLSKNQLTRHKAWNSIGGKSNLVQSVESQLDSNEIDTNIETLNETAKTYGAEEIIIKGFTSEAKEAVEKELKQIAKSLVDGMNKRLKISDLQCKALYLFGDFSEEKLDVSTAELQTLIDTIPGPFAEQYSAEDNLPGYRTWLEFGMSLKAKTPNISNEDIWSKFYEKFNESFPNFIDLYQDINIRTTSEAMAETVGSVMNAHTSRGRNPHPYNFDIEIRLRFNLPPLHCLDDLIEKILEQQIKDKAFYI